MTIYHHLLHCLSSSSSCSTLPSSYCMSNVLSHHDIPRQVLASSSSYLIMSRDFHRQYAIGSSILNHFSTTPYPLAPATQTVQPRYRPRMHSPAGVAGTASSGPVHLIIPEDRRASGVRGSKLASDSSTPHSVYKTCHTFPGCVGPLHPRRLP